jgi:hypothetical protein
MNSIAEVQTPLAATYLARLCKHFSKKIPVEYSETEGQACFPSGHCRLLAEAETLTFHCEAEDPAALAHMQTVISHHVSLFTRHNPLVVAWRSCGD